MVSIPCSSGRRARGTLPGTLVPQSFAGPCTETSPLKRPSLRFPYWPAPAPRLCRCCRRVPPEKGSLATSPRIPQTVGAQGFEAAREGSVCTMFHCSVRYYTYVMVPPASPREREYHNKGVSFPGGTPEQRNTDPQRAAEPRERPGGQQRAAPPRPPPTAEQTNTNATDKRPLHIQQAHHRLAPMNDAG
jgi:hypothetical protein